MEGMNVPLTIYKTFVSRLLIMYALSTGLAIATVGGLMIFMPFSLDRQEHHIIIGILVISICIMLILEWLVFKLQLKPIRIAFLEGVESYQSYQSVYFRTHRFPEFAAKRILGPHLFGLMLPMVSLTLLSIHMGRLSIPYYYIVLVFFTGVLIVCMLTLIEFYLTYYFIRPVLLELSTRSHAQFGKELSLGGRVFIPLKLKLRWSFFLMGAFPVLLYSLSLQFGTEGWELGRVTSWYWAIGVLTVGLGYSFIGSRLLAREIVMPIQHLYERMSDVQIGYMQTSASDLFSDEFSRLVWGFNHMLRGINVQHARNNQLVESYFATLAAALDARDPYTAGHSLRVADYAVLIGKLAKLREEELNELRKSALLHDIGKIGIRDSVLLKEGKLTDEEWVQIKDHPVLGETILRQIEPASFMASILPGVRSHHERYDGRGYPDGLQGEDIPLFGRIIAVADAFDAMTSDRPYRAGLDSQKALGILEEGRGTQWDPYFVALFVEYMQKDSFEEQNLDIRRTSP
ncbi:MAG TPA: HD-GYP domain-containing protein [Paenibacillus sp.]|jgi:hypothetical protein